MIMIIKEENLNGEGHIIVKLISYPVVNDRWGATGVATLFSLHFILFSASLTASQNFIPAHSFILSWLLNLTQMYMLFPQMNEVCVPCSWDDFIS